MRKEAKSARRAKCSYSKCNKNPFLKSWDIITKDYTTVARDTQEK